MEALRSARGLLLLLLVLGAAATLACRGLPLVRNSLVYARASDNVIAHGYDPRPVVADSRLSYDKPILYAWISAPFVRALGSHDGLRLTSFLGTAAYLLAVLYFARAFLPQGAGPLLWLSAFGPCVLYQFWSAHPDSWFAALAVTAWALSRRIVLEPASSVRRMILLGAVLYVAILFKNYGLVLLASCPLYLLVHWRTLRTGGARFRTLLWTAAAVFGVLGALVLLAWTGHNPLSRLEGEGGGVGQYGQGVLATSIRGTCLQLGLSFLIQFHVALAFAFRRAAWSRELAAPLLCFGLPYVAGLMPFPTTFYNMRYFVPLFPLAALVLARGAAALPQGPRRALWGAHGGAAALLVLVFNWAPAYRAAEPLLPALEVDWLGPRLSLLDNLRMKLHLEQADTLANINRTLPQGADLYMLDVVYYGDAQQGVYERAGLIRPDIRTHYVSSRDFQPPAGGFYLWSFVPGNPFLQRLPQLTDLGRSLYHAGSGD